MNCIRLVAVLALGVLVGSPAGAQEIVDPRSGRLILVVTDLVVPAGPVSLEYSRTLHVRSDRGMVNARWWSNWDSRLVRSAQHLSIDEASGPTVFLPANSGPPGYT